jgi:hypothetical protein
MRAAAFHPEDPENAGVIFGAGKTEPRKRDLKSPTFNKRRLKIAAYSLRL